ncbi:MAG TPA: phosphotransferase [Steroidobacteraceae bacterium]|nr:phosphotransferase [Steroidobacteraceae bacterium]
MTVSFESIPRFSAAEALEAARAGYGLCGEAAALPSERDQNFVISDPRRGKFVLKIANREDSAELLDFQHQAMRRVARAGCRVRVPEVVPSLAGALVQTLRSGAGLAYRVRLLTWVEGTVLTDCRPRAAALLESIGACLACIDRALESCVHPAMHRVLQWDLRHAGLARGKAALMPSRWRRRVEAAFARWDEVDWAALRHGVIHGDANEDNVLVSSGRMCGLLDFGDMVHSATVCELAVALAYAMLRERDPLESAAALIRGYHRHNPLSDAEQLALYPLVLARLAASLCYAAYNRRLNPGDPYQVVSEEPARELLERLEAYPADAAPAMIRGACGAAITPNRSP